MDTSSFSLHNITYIVDNKTMQLVTCSLRDGSIMSNKIKNYYCTQKNEIRERNYIVLIVVFLHLGNIMIIRIRYSYINVDSKCWFEMKDPNPLQITENEMYNDYTLNYFFCY